MKTIRRIILDPKKVWSVLFKKTGEYKLNDDVLVKLENEGLCVYFSEPILDKPECEPQQIEPIEMDSQAKIIIGNKVVNLIAFGDKLNELVTAVNTLLRERNNA